MVLIEIGLLVGGLLFWNKSEDEKQKNDGYSSETTISSKTLIIKNTEKGQNVMVDICKLSGKTIRFHDSQMHLIATSKSRVKMAEIDHKSVFGLNADWIIHQITGTQFTLESKKYPGFYLSLASGTNELGLVHQNQSIQSKLSFTLKRKGDETYTLSSVLNNQHFYGHYSEIHSTQSSDRCPGYYIDILE